MLDKLVIQEILKLRKRGFSYRQIHKTIPVSKSTISRLCSKVQLSKTQLKKLRKRKIDGLVKATKISSRARSVDAKQREKEIIQKEKTSLGKLSKRDRFIAGISLYMADGTKKGNCVDFTNSDPKIINFMTKWFVEFLKVRKNQIRASLWLHQNLDEKTAIKYWNNLTKIPISNFGKTYFAENKAKSNKTRHQKHNFGIIKIRVYRIFKLRQIKGWIEGVLV